jgi:hypothetical protein
MRIQSYMKAWMLWYYGHGEYPITLQNQLTHEEMIQVREKKKAIVEIVGRPDRLDH